MVTFVSLILVQKEEYGMKVINHANVQKIKFGKIKHVFLQKFYVLMGNIGILQFMLALVLQELFHQ